MVTSEVPVTTLVFLGGIMMVGAMGSAGPPTSGQTGGDRGVRTHTYTDTHTQRGLLSKER